VANSQDFSRRTFSSAYCASRVIGWLLRLLTLRAKANDKFIECYCAALGEELGDAAAQADLGDRVLARISRHGHHGALHLEELAMRIESLREGEGQIQDFLGEAASLSAQARQAVLDELAPLGERLRQGLALREWDLDHNNVANGIRRLKETYDLEPGTLLVCEFLHIMNDYLYANSYFYDELHLDASTHTQQLGALLGVDGIEERLDLLGSMGLINGDRADSPLMSSVVLDRIFADAFDPNDLFFSPMSGDTLALGEFGIRAEERGHVLRLLSGHPGFPVNILIHGAPGTGKTTFVRSVASAAGMTAYEVLSKARDKDGDRRGKLVIARRALRSNPNAIVVVDEAERLLCTDYLNGTSANKDKAWLNSLLESNDCPTIWVTNDISDIDPAVRRRFAYSLEFQPITEKRRGQLLSRLLAREGVKMGDAEIARISRDYPLEAAHLSDAITQVKALYPRTRRFGHYLTLVLSSTMGRIAGEAPRQEKRKHQASRPFASFTLEGACAKGADLDLLIYQIKKIDALLRKEGTLRPGLGTMLFYGPPGTGKSELGRYLAHLLGRKARVVRASDLLDCYVGNTEKRIAEAFARAEAEGQVLIFDEADSFLQSRERALHSFEVTAVNEFLTCLEACRGLCVCTTNFDRNLDAAAIRRFTRKLEFTTAGPAQALALYARILRPLSGRALSAAEERELLRIPALVPGDFQVVRGRFDPLFTERAGRDNPTLIAALREEAQRRSRPGSAAPIGFFPG
nr:AAA family ATPase [Succinivibrionaceae bacterium]